jgi:hypothetical protein
MKPQTTTVPDNTSDLFVADLHWPERGVLPRTENLQVRLNHIVAWIVPEPDGDSDRLDSEPVPVCIGGYNHPFAIYDTKQETWLEFQGGTRGTGLDALRACLVRWFEAEKTWRHLEQRRADEETEREYRRVHG